MYIRGFGGRFVVSHLVQGALEREFVGVQPVLYKCPLLGTLFGWVSFACCSTRIPNLRLQNASRHIFAFPSQLQPTSCTLFGGDCLALTFFNALVQRSVMRVLCMSPAVCGLPRSMFCYNMVWALIPMSVLEISPEVRRVAQL